MNKLYFYYQMMQLLLLYQTWYPNLDQVIQDLRQQDVRVLGYVTGHLNVEGEVYDR